MVLPAFPSPPVPGRYSDTVVMAVLREEWEAVDLVAPT
jgi:hypothetical protein